MGVGVMVGKNRRRYSDGHWHHRVPDYELVYCGPEGVDKDGRTLTRGETKREHFQKPRSRPKKTLNSKQAT